MGTIELMLQNETKLKAVIVLFMFYVLLSLFYVLPAFLEKPSYIKTEEPVEIEEATDIAIETKETIYTNMFNDDLETAEQLIGYLKQECPNIYMAYGILGMFYRESSFQSDAYAGWTYSIGETLEGETYADMCARKTREWTNKVDAGLKDGSTKDEFINMVFNAYGGYGLAQWWCGNFLEDFYNYAAEYGTSIGDAKMQCAFTVHDIQTNRPELWADLCKCTDAYQAGYLIAKLYEVASIPESSAEFAYTFYMQIEDASRI